MKYFGTITDPKDLVNKEYIDNIADTKANIDGAYENMTVGNAEQLVSTVMVNDQEPYTFRTSGGSADIGDREFDTIVGGSLPWNQLWPQPNFESTSGVVTTDSATISVSNNVLTITGPTPNQLFNLVATTSYRIQPSQIINHVIMLVADIKSNVPVTFKPTSYIADGSKSLGVLSATTRVWYIWKPASIGEGHVFNMAIAFSPVTDIVGAGEISNYCAFDLTQMFGTEIADYIYTLEQSNEGDGYSWFTHYFPNPYYAYNPGNSLLHVQGLQSHDMTGFNQWDEEWEVGTYNTTTGATQYSDTKIRSKNKIPVLPGQTYYYNGGGYATQVFAYDVNGNFIRTLSAWNNDSTLVIPDGVFFINISPAATYGTVYKNDININLSWDGERNGEYEPYKLNSYPLDSTITLRGIPKLDANNKLKYDGDRYLADGTVDRRYGIVDLGSLNWSWSTEANAFVAEVTGTATAVVGGVGAICSKYIRFVGSQSDWANVVTGYFALNFFGIFSSRMVIRDTAYTDAAAFKAALSGVYLVYELATPTTETAEPYQSPQIVDDWGTEEYVVTLQGDVAVPVGHDTNYANNLRAKLEMAPESPSGDGDYIVRQTSGQNAYVPLVFPVDELPVVPSEDGSYTLQVTISGGTATYSWVSA